MLHALSVEAACHLHRPHHVHDQLHADLSHLGCALQVIDCNAIAFLLSSLHTHLMPGVAAAMPEQPGGSSPTALSPELDADAVDRKPVLTPRQIKAGRTDSGIFACSDPELELSGAWHHAVLFQ